MVAQLDGNEDTPLKDHTIPKAIAFQDKEIIKSYMPA
jgi:hypothetical protein